MELRREYKWSCLIFDFRGFAFIATSGFQTALTDQFRLPTDASRFLDFRHDGAFAENRHRSRRFADGDRNRIRYGRDTGRRVVTSAKVYSRKDRAGAIEDDEAK